MVRPADDAPNILLIVLDDVGFAQLGCYGSDISTPVIDGLASGGLRLANFHTTALCSPTRSCLLTGRNHHNNGMGRIADLAMDGGTPRDLAARSRLPALVRISRRRPISSCRPSITTTTLPRAVVDVFERASVDFEARYTAIMAEQ